MKNKCFITWHTGTLDLPSGGIYSQGPVPPGTLWPRGLWGGVEGGVGAPGEPWETVTKDEVCFSIQTVNRSGEERVEAKMGGSGRSS